MQAEAPICPLCGRPIPEEAKQSLHHLVPRLRGGKGCGSELRQHRT